LQVFFELAAFQSFHQPTLCARRKLYAMAFQPPPLRVRFYGMAFANSKVTRAKAMVQLQVTNA